MAVGLRIFNDNGISQISDIHKNMFLIAKGTVQSSNSNSDPRYAIQYGDFIQVTSPDPVFFAATAPGGAIAHLIEITGNTYKGAVLYGIHGQPATWYAFSYPRNLPTNLGLQVFNAQGSLMYDAAQKPLRLIHQSIINVPWGSVFPQPSFTASQIDLSPSSPPPDIFITQTRKNRTYASMGICLVPYRKAEKVYVKNWRFGHGLFYYMPVQDPNGIRLKARWNHFTGLGTTFPPGVETLGHNTLPYAASKQVSWIIDVTGY